MAVNQILPFATTDTGTNLLTQAEYEADQQRLIGHQPGVARSKLENKALKQATLLAAGLGEYLARHQNNDIIDTLTPAQIADYLESVINAVSVGGVTTPPQFDNSTAIATTEFVKRQGLEHAGVTLVTSNTTLPGSLAGRVIVLKIGIFGTGGTVTLPSTSSVPVGATFTFISARDNQTLQRQGSDVLYMNAENYNGTDDVTSLVFGIGDTLTLVQAGAGKWYAVDGTVQARYVGAAPSTEFSLGTNGYQRLSSGLVLQWGRVDFPDIRGDHLDVQVTFPVAFPNAVFTFTPSIGLNNPGSYKSAAQFNVNSLTTTGVTATVSEWTDTGNAGTLHWHATGY